ncbi:MAG: rRNA maturation RNase YbeY [Flavihumibacter sp.]
MRKSTDIIEFHYLVRDFSFPQRQACKSFIVRLFRKEKLPLSHLRYIFCDDEYLLDINRRFLRHDYYTDIISFPLSAPGEPFEGEVYISIPRVKENAQIEGEPFNRELHRVLFHGALHFCGYKDKSKADQQRMREREEDCLRGWEKLKVNNQKSKRGR